MWEVKPPSNLNFVVSTATSWPLCVTDRLIEFVQILSVPEGKKELWEKNTDKRKNKERKKIKKESDMQLDGLI